MVEQAVGQRMGRKLELAEGISELDSNEPGKRPVSGRSANRGKDRYQGRPQLKGLQAAVHTRGGRVAANPGAGNTHASCRPEHNHTSFERGRRFNRDSPSQDQIARTGELGGPSGSRQADPVIESSDSMVA